MGISGSKAANPRRKTVVNPDTGPAVPANAPPPEPHKRFTKSLKSKTFGSIEEIPIEIPEATPKEKKIGSKDKKTEQMKRLLGQAYKVSKQPARTNKRSITDLISQMTRTGPQTFDIADASLKRRQGGAQRDADEYIASMAGARGIDLAGLLAYKILQR